MNAFFTPLNTYFSQQGEDIFIYHNFMNRSTPDGIFAPGCDTRYHIIKLTDHNHSIKTKVICFYFPQYDSHAVPFTPQ
jgi:hypothetical protein